MATYSDGCTNPMCRYGPDDTCANPRHSKNQPGRFKKKPVVIEAIQWWGDNLKEVIAFTGRHESAADWSDEYFQEVVDQQGLKIFTLEGHHMASIGDWIIKGVQGEFYPCKPDIFAETYEPA